MKCFKRLSVLGATGSLLVLMSIAMGVSAADPQEIIAGVESNAHTSNEDSVVGDVLDLEVGLGAMQKVRGQWRFKNSERVSGERQRNTWQMASGFSSSELFDQLVETIEQDEGSERLFACTGRACGHGSQWANTVFAQRILYGRDDLQRYSVYRIQGDVEYRVLIYSSARSSTRQYLHIDLIELVAAQ